MKLVGRKTTYAILAMLTMFVGIGAFSAPAFAWNPCTLVLTPSTQSTTIPAGTTVAFTYLLTYNDAGHPAHFTMSYINSNPAWTVVSIVPNPTATITTTVTITVTVKAPTTVGSTTTLTLKAANSGDSSANCQASGTLLTAGFPPTGVPQFPVGMLALVALALPAMILLKKKFSIATPV